MSVQSEIPVLASSDPREREKQKRSNSADKKQHSPPVTIPKQQTEAPVNSAPSSTINHHEISQWLGDTSAISISTTSTVARVPQPAKLSQPFDDGDQIGRLGQDRKKGDYGVQGERARPVRLGLFVE